MWTSIHSRLQTACIYFWPVAADCRQLVAEAEMDASRMTFDEPPALRWESVILQGDKQRSLNKLAPVLLRRYPDNPQLIEAVSPWIKGNPPEAAPASPPPPAPPVETPIVVTTTIRKEKVHGTETEVELVPVTVPAEFAEDASVALVATINSLRKTVAQHERDLQELIVWRAEISRLSRSEMAERVGGNEQDPKGKA